GGVITNPRFVLVYDTNFENGDVVTQGFDPTTGLSAPIAAKPAEDPVDIPDTDSTGETRALIQNKSSEKDKFTAESSSGNGKTTPDGSTNNINASSTDLVLGTLDLKQSPTSTITDTVSQVDQVVVATTTDESTLELTEFDLILLPTEPVPDNNSSSSDQAI
ncbi:hypothetical protein H6785_03505, partial [Candidatus Nomurabacteria bacterium]|nr:hypothetical protein [Candidatus Nomurabacteria bacterium]